MIVGRSQEKQRLMDEYALSSASLAIIYGRRRIGKSSLVQDFATDKPSLLFEALENGQTTDQISHFTRQLKTQLNSPLFNNLSFASWEGVFDFITEYAKTQEQKLVIFFDEFQWMAAGRQSLVALIKYYWDNHWKALNVMLILCGSIASYMVNRVIRSKALYGRSTLEMKLGELTPYDSFELLKKKRSWEETLQYLLIFGGIPKYLEELDTSKPLSKNINDLLFCDHALFANELEKIFYSQFKAPQKYKKIVKALSRGPLTFGGISNVLGVSSGGTLKTYLEHLELAGFIRSVVPFGKSNTSKAKVYKLADAYLVFYFKYVEPNIDAIRSNSSRNLFKILVEKQWQSWLGFQFEAFCMKHYELFAKNMGFLEELIKAGPYFEPGSQHKGGKRSDAQGFQIDLLYERADKTITLCEIKYHQKVLDASIIAEVQRKCERFKVPRGYTLERAVISLYGVDQKTLDSGYFHHVVTAKELFDNPP